MTVEPQLIDVYVASGQAQLVFVPMLDHNPRSMAASKAVYCAGEQAPASFWDMHDVMFERQNEFWAVNDIGPLLKDIAAGLALDSAAFAECYDSERYEAELDAADQARRADGIRRRPSFDITGPGLPDGRRVEGGVPFAVFQQVVGEAAGS